MTDPANSGPPNSNPVQVGIIMGSRSDWDTMKAAAETLEALGIAHETRVVSAHRTPDRMFEYAEQAAAELQALPPSDARRLLGELARFVVERQS